MREAEAGQDPGGARRRRMGADVGEPRLDLGDAMGIAARVSASASSALRSRSAASTISIRLSGPSGASCGSRPMRARAGQRDRAVLRRDIAGDRAKQRRLAGAVAADQADARAVRHAGGSAFEQAQAGNAHGEIVDHEHAPGIGRTRARMQGLAMSENLPPVRRREGWRGSFRPRSRINSDCRASSDAEFSTSVGRSAGLGGGRGDDADIFGDLAGPERGLLDVVRDLLGRGLAAARPRPRPWPRCC